MAGLARHVQRILGDLPPGVVRALEQVDPAAFLPAGLGCLAGADAPLPFFERNGAVALTPSPRVAAMVLQLLELGAGERVLLVGAESGYLAALALEAGAASVRVVEPDLEVAEAARGLLAAAGLGERVEVRTGPPAKEAEGTPWDRILLLDPRRTLSPALAQRLADLGFGVAFTHTSEGFQVVRTLRSGDATAELRADLRLQPGLPEGPGAAFKLQGRDRLHGLLALEEMAARVWQAGTRTTIESELARGVDETWRRPPEELASWSEAERTRRDLAKRVFHLGFLFQSAGDLEGAADLYQRSHAAMPGAEAMTFLGWVRAHEGRLEEAMACCHRAIAADPTLGNPYNDIGAYLLQLDRPQEAIPWFERALGAPRYEAPVFPRLNLARAYIALGDAAAARARLRECLDLQPGYGPALDLLRQLERRGAGPPT
jgi:protein-L-isoaspartate O-methyltransferase